MLVVPGISSFMHLRICQSTHHAPARLKPKYNNKHIAANETQTTNCKQM